MRLKLLLIMIGIASTLGCAAQTQLKISIGGKAFTATAADNATATAFVAKLPMPITMNELNGNEKYCYLDATFPTAASNPGTIHQGDIMLYGSNCLVIFYKTFATSYSYTRIGSISNATDLSDMGSSNVTVTIEKVDPTTGIAEVDADTP